MFVLITYDVSTQTAEGRARLRKVAKLCVNYGTRVQYSVFECVLDAATYRLLRHQLAELIDPRLDSVRLYPLADGGRHKVEHIGAKPALDVTAPLLL